MIKEYNFSLENKTLVKVSSPSVQCYKTDPNSQLIYHPCLPVADKTKTMFTEL